MIDLWWTEARRYQVLPLDNRPLAALEAPRRAFHSRQHATYFPSPHPVPENNAINTKGRSHRIVATVDVPVDTTPFHGVLLAMGTVLGGWSFHALDGRLRYASNYVGRDQYVVESDTEITSGEHALIMTFDARPDFSGTVQLYVDGVEVGRGEIPRTTPVRHSISGAGMTCGWEQGPPVGPGYSAPFACTGTITSISRNITPAAGSKYTVWQWAFGQ